MRTSALLAVIISLFSIGHLNSQNITSGEHFWDNDPGLGNGISFAVEAGEDINESLTISTSTLSKGFHRLGIRLMDENENWSITHYSNQLIQDETAYPISSGEYFWDSDPGVGNGISFSVNGNEFDQTFSTQSEGLEEGSHQLCYRLQASNNVWSISNCRSITICTDYEPVSGFSFHKDNYTIYCSDTSLHADEIIYQIHDEENELVAELNQFNLAYTFALAGEYSVTQVAINECGVDSSTHQFLVRGIDDIFPSVTGTNTLYLADITGGFRDDPTIHLTMNGSSITADTVLVVNAESHRVKFWIDESTPLGDYDVVVVYADGNDTLHEAVSIEERIDFQPTSNITGSRQFLINTWKPYRIYFENQGNTSEFGVPFYIGLPGVVQAKVLSPITADSIPNEVLDSYPVDEFTTVLDDAEDSMTYMLLMIPVMRPNELGYVDIAIRTSDLTPVPIKTGFARGLFTAEEINNFDEFSRTSCNFINPCFQPVLDLLGIAGPVGCVIGAASLGCSIGNMANGLGSGAGFGGWGSAFTNLGLDVASVLTCGAAGPDELQDAFTMINVALGFGSSVNSLFNIQPPGGGGGGGDGGSGGGIGGGCGGCKSDGGCGGDIGIFLPAGSIDPNEKSGPSGPSDDQYIAANKNQIIYRINFENIDTATAPAREVFVLDQLNAEFLDWSNLQFTSFQFADSVYYFDDAILDEFIRDFDLRPAKNTILRVEGNVDVNGKVSVAFHSLDPETMDLTESVEDGFLNPNVNAPEGEGYIEFLVGTKDLTHLDVIENSANIVFDGNDAILTNLWFNTVDDVRPESEVSHISQSSEEDTLYYVHVNGTDANSGIAEYEIWMALDTGAYYPLVLHFTGDSAIVWLENDREYKFLSVAIDQVLNFEEFPDDALNNPDVTYSTFLTGIQQDISKETMAHVYPNPVNELLVLTMMNESSATFSARLYNISMQEVGRWDLTGKTNSLDVHRFTKGIYFLEIIDNKRREYISVIIQ